MPPGAPPMSSIWSGRPSSLTPLYVLMAWTASRLLAKTTSAVPCVEVVKSWFKRGQFVGSIDEKSRETDGGDSFRLFFARLAAKHQKKEDPPWTGRSGRS